MAVRKILMLKKEEKIWTFLLEDDVIVEIHCSLPDSDQHRQPVLGDIYIGKVKNIAANIGAAFIEIAPGKECYYDLSQAPQANRKYQDRYFRETSPFSSGYVQRKTELSQK